MILACLSCFDFSSAIPKQPHDRFKANPILFIRSCSHCLRFLMKWAFTVFPRLIGVPFSWDIIAVVFFYTLRSFSVIFAYRRVRAL